MGPRCSSAETQVCHRSYIIAASITGFVIRVRVLVLNATFNNILVILCTWWLVLLVQETGLRPRPRRPRFVIRSNTADIICIAGNDNTFGAPVFIPVFSGVRVARSFVFCVMFCRSLFVLLPFFFCHCIVFPSIYGF